MSTSGSLTVSVVQLAPDAFAAVAALESELAAEDDLTRLARTAVAAVLVGGSETRPTDDRLAGAHDLAQQMTMDVSAVTAAQRRAALGGLGPDGFPFVQAVYAFDLSTRVRLALEQLYGEQLPPPPATPSGSGLWAAIEELLRSVARLSALDPVTSELVRLRGARAHACRLCQSLRDVRALDAGADEAVFDLLDDYESSDLPLRQKVALRLVDAMIWQPASFPAELPRDVATHLSRAEGVEVVLDVMRNAANKVAVVLGADAARTEGVELYTVGDDGEPVYGLTR